MNTLRFLLLVTFLFFSVRASAVDPITVAQTFDGIQDTVDQAKSSAIEVIHAAGVQAQAILDRIKLDFVDVMDKRVDELGEDLQRELRGLVELTEQALESVNTLPQCIGNEASYATASLRAGLEASLSRLPLVKEGRPTALLLHEQGRRRPFVVRADAKEKLIVVKGSNFWNSEDVCSISAHVARAGAPATKLPLSVLASSDEEFVLHSAGGLASGDYVVSLSAAPKKKWWQWGSCGDVESVSLPFQAIPLPKLDVKVSATPYCAQADTYVYKCSAAMVAGSCKSGTETASKLCVFDKPGYSLVSSTLKIDAAHRGGASTTRSGSNVQVSYYAGRRGKFCKRGTGRIAWTVTMLGTKETSPTLGEKFSTEPFEIRASQDSDFQLPVADVGCKATGWVLEASAVNSATEQSIVLGPERSDTSQVVNMSAYPASMTVELPSGKGRARLLASSCLEY